jgi:hypothetical protein
MRRWQQDWWVIGIGLLQGIALVMVLELNAKIDGWDLNRRQRALATTDCAPAIGSPPVAPTGPARH